MTVFQRQLKKFTHEDQIAAVLIAAGFPVVQQFPVALGVTVLADRRRRDPRLSVCVEGREVRHPAHLHPDREQDCRRECAHSRRETQPVREHETGERCGGDRMRVKGEPAKDDPRSDQACPD